MDPALPATASSESALAPRQLETLRVLLNALVPASADGRLPGAADIPPLVRQIARAATRLPDVTELLATLDREALTQWRVAFAQLDDAARRSLLERMRALSPAALDRLALETVTAYYQQDAVVQALGLETRPPYPKGYQVDQGDLSLLNPVIARGTIYRDLP